jgi:hypothetical protein
VPKDGADAQAIAQGGGIFKVVAKAVVKDDGGARVVSKSVAQVLPGTTAQI